MKITRKCKVCFGLIAAVFLVLVLALPWLNRWSSSPGRHRALCAENLTRLHKALVDFSQENNGFLATEQKWHEILIEHGLAKPEDFICPNSKTKIGLSDYALNEHALQSALNVNGKYVLLFETSPGKILVGNSEDITFDNHSYWHETTRCGFLLADGSVIFVRPDNINELEWNP